MTTQYQFDFSKLTWHDIDMLPRGGLTALAIVDRLCVGGIRELSLSEVADVLMPQFVEAFERWRKYGKIGDVMSKPDAGSSATIRYYVHGKGWQDLGVVTQCSLTIGGDDDDDSDDEGLSDLLDDIEGLE